MMTLMGIFTEMVSVSFISQIDQNNWFYKGKERQVRGDREGTWVHTRGILCCICHLTEPRFYKTQAFTLSGCGFQQDCCWSCLGKTSLLLRNYQQAQHSLKLIYENKI